MASGCGRTQAQLRLPLGDSAADDASGVLSDGAISARCRHCGRPVDLPDWFREAGVRLHYCDERCRQAWVEAEPDFSVRSVHRGRRRRGGNWELQARRARERDQFRCQVCGVTEEELGGRLHVHHRIPFRRFRSNVEANKLEHLISVCPSCHQAEEAEVRRHLPLFAASPTSG